MRDFIDGCHCEIPICRCRKPSVDIKLDEVERFCKKEDGYKYCKSYACLTEKQKKEFSSLNLT